MPSIPQNKIQDYDTSQIDSKDIAQTIEQMRIVAYNHRRIHERRWYDNNFFDDGFHFRYLSRTTNKIVDLSERATVYAPQRAIPKASRQIRGVANLLLSSDPTPTIYPEETPQTDNPEQDKQVKEQSKKEALNKGYWLEEEWREPDKSGENILQKLALMPILTAKHSISYMQIWADDKEEKIRTQVYDAFDLYVIGSYNNIEDLPFIIKATPLLISTIRANPAFDEDAVAKVMADNKPAESEVKQAYMRARYGRDASSDQAGTAILYESFVKEYINEDNMKRIRTQKDADIILNNRRIGDSIIRQTFIAGGEVLLDTYLNMDEYPFVEFRFELGPLYQVPFIERFINANKSLDSAVSRMERYFHTMVTGIWMKRRGEQFKINNIAGGQVIEYDQAAPIQANLASPGQWTFEFMGLLNSFIEEQGVSLSTLGKLPAGVKGHQAIESLKESEYANLVISSRRLKGTVAAIARKMFKIADDHFLTPKSISHTDRGETNYFQVMGKSAMQRRNEAGIDNPANVVPLSGESKIDIEIENGMAYTRQGQQEAAKAIIDTMLQWAQAGFLPQEAVKPVIQSFLEQYQFGSTAELMAAFDEGGIGIDDQTLQKMKMAVLEALKDAGEIGEEGDQKDVMATKIGVLEALQETGVLKKILGEDPTPDPVQEAEIDQKHHDMMLKEEANQVKIEQTKSQIAINEDKARQDMQIKEEQARQDQSIKEKNSQVQRQLMKSQKNQPKAKGGSQK